MTRGPRRGSHAPLAAAAATLVVTWGATLIATAGLEPTHDSVALVAFSPRDPVEAPAETMVLTTPRYVELLDSRAVQESAEALVAAAGRPGATGDAAGGTRVSGSIDPGTLNLRVTVRAEDAETAATVANLVAARVIREAADDDLVSAELVAPAVPDPAAVPPSPAQWRGAGLAAGGLLAALAAVVVLRVRRAEVRRPR